MAHHPLRRGGGASNEVLALDRPVLLCERMRATHIRRCATTIQNSSALYGTLELICHRCGSSLLAAIRATQQRESVSCIRFVRAAMLSCANRLKSDVTAQNGELWLIGHAISVSMTLMLDVTRRPCKV